MEDSMKKMDYTIGFQDGCAGQKWTATALTDRAKERTPEPVMFAGRPEASKFLKDSQAEGYRFSGTELVDPEQRLVKNRYFVIGGDGQLTPSGEDNGPRDTVWEIGDVMPGRDRSVGVEAIVENVLQGPGVRERFGCDLAFLLRLHVVAQGNLVMSSIAPFDPAKPCPCGLHGKSYGDCCKDKGVHAPGNEMLRGTAPRMVPGALSQIQSSMVNAKDDTRFRIAWNKVWYYPQHETFHQFLDALVVATLGKEWFEMQLLLPLKNQNEIVKWRKAMVELLRRPGDADDNVSTGHTLTGPTKAYQCFGYDLYWLQLVHRLPDSLIKRLKDFHKFQGARYEILIAAVFTRAGFDIEWIDDTKASGKHPEFIATHKRTGRKIAVEAKSRRRAGSINFPGTVTPETHLKGDVFPLYDAAIPKAPDGDIPFLIFIDANVPDSPQKGLPSYSHIPIETTPWMQEIRDGLMEIWDAATELTPESAVVITNFAFYYGDNDNPSPTGMGAFFASKKPKVPVPDDPMMADLAYCFQTYDTVPRQI
jgi:hypothetical protein